MRHALCLLLLALSAAACSSLTDSFVEVKCTRGSECGSGVCDEHAHRCSARADGLPCTANSECLGVCVDGVCAGTSDTCFGGRYVVVDRGDPGLVVDKQTGLEWQRNSSCCYTQPDAAAHCQSLGMRLPTKDEALAITPTDSCAWANGWATWTSTVSGPSRWWFVFSDGDALVSDGDGDYYTLCVR